MDADDLCEPERVVSQLAFAKAHSQFVLFPVRLTLRQSSSLAARFYQIRQSFKIRKSTVSCAVRFRKISLA